MSRHGETDGMHLRKVLVGQASSTAKQGGSSDEAESYSYGAQPGITRGVGLMLLGWMTAAEA